jgi:hypothetical protein
MPLAYRTKNPKVLLPKWGKYISHNCKKNKYAIVKMIKVTQHTNANYNNEVYCPPNPLFQSNPNMFEHGDLRHCSQEDP